MKVALIGDIHANLPALEAVLEHAQLQGAEVIWNVGDFVGYGAFPDQVVRRLRKVAQINIIGNYDLKVLKVKKKAQQWKEKKAPEKWLAFQWAYEHLSKKSRKFLRTLPEQVHLQIEGHTVLLVHGSPASIDEHLVPSTPEQRMMELARLAGVEVVVCGHSHVPFMRRVAGTWFVNTGSVGRPDDGDPRACYAVMSATQGEVEFTHYRVPYDVERAAQAIREAGLPEDFARMVLEGKNLTAVQNHP